ncbi:MAG: Alpha-D-glucose-1-phosphate phosphatase YihX [Syntrophorhabdaceae bacterium PtaU1.Bin034]|nr:MAG: Alpha-D-glucose-1-phosphate phosphatase YihX [Syntrophorhabdaceae bacterium PtaU1.Bin034]
MTKLFVFDLGNVILPFDNRQVADKLHARSKISHKCEAREIFGHLFDLRTGAINGYEEGLSSSLEFFLNLKNRYQLDMEFEEFKDIWNNIFRENLEVNEIIVYLKAKGFPLFLLSNTNELHFTYIIERYPIVHLMDEWILSFEVGAKKPKKRIYDAIFEKMDVRRDEVFYIDDVEEYVEYAKGTGMKGLVFREPADLWDALKANGA